MVVVHFISCIGFFLFYPPPNNILREKLIGYYISRDDDTERYSTGSTKDIYILRLLCLSRVDFPVLKVRVLGHNVWTQLRYTKFI